MLSDCTRFTSDQKDDIFRQKLNKAPTNSNKRPTNKQNPKHGHTHKGRTSKPAPRTHANISKTLTTKKPVPVLKLDEKVKQRAAPAWSKPLSTHQANSSNVVKHYARVARANVKSKKASDVPTGKADTYMGQQRQHYKVAQAEHGNKDMMKDVVMWLIDSGCSNHMTSYLEDLIADHEEVDCVVEVATGVLVPATTQGTAKIKITDVVTGDKCIVMLHNVLYVPGLTKRLLSVRQ